MIPPVLLLGALDMGMAGPAAFVPARLTRSYTQHPDAPPAVVFPLLGPVQETTAAISLTWTGLSTRGNEFSEGHRSPPFEGGMGEWESGLNAYLRKRATE